MEYSKYPTSESAMRFEKFLLDNYMATEEGKNVLDFFENIHSYMNDNDKDGKILRFIDSLLYAPIAQHFFSFKNHSSDIFVSEDTGQELFTFDSFAEDYISFITDLKSNWKCTDRDMLSEIPNLSLSVHYYCASEYAFPYLYPSHFNILQNIFEEFNIHFPQLPGPRQYEARWFYYIELCKSLYEFRKLHDMTPEELCVFLYGFAPKFISHNVKHELPLPNAVWVVGATDEDSESFLKDVKKDAVQWWAGNPRMQHGDIVLIYEKSPYSAIKTVWRAISDGFDDPFQYFSGKVWLGEPLPIPPVTFEALKNDPVLSKCGLIVAKMYGLGGGKVFNKDEYESFLGLLKNSEFDTSLLPELISYNIEADVEINNEQDVEKHLLEPFLAKLGVQQSHLTRQMPLRMGRGVRYYPDYVINAKTNRGEESGAFVWEAKYRITSNKQLREDFYQAKSYALRLNTNGLGLVSCEGIWLSFSDDYSVDGIKHYTWKDVQNQDIFSEIVVILKKAFGKL